MIEAKEINPQFKYKIAGMANAEKLMLCFQCGTCTANCPIARFTDYYRPRKLAWMVQLGLEDRLLSDESLWLCSTCFRCIDNCPQGVEIASIVRALRNISAKERKTSPLVYKSLGSNLLKTGYVYVIPESRVRRRLKEGLPPIPKSKVEDVRRILDATGFSTLLEELETFERVEG